FGESDCSPRIKVLAPPPTTWQHHLNSDPWNVSVLSPCMSTRVLKIVCSPFYMAFDCPAHPSLT
ncbi:hypothetical protein LEMLEM_LOCUS17291, partial [Lemmus lemmus]